MFGFQTGFLGTDGGNIYFVRLLNANIEVFNRAGVLLRTLHPSGVEADFLSKTNVKDPNFWNDIRNSVASLKVNGQWLSLVIHDKDFSNMPQPLAVAVSHVGGLTLYLTVSTARGTRLHVPFAG